MKSQTQRLIGATLASAYFINYVVTAQDWHFIDTVNLIFHEAGHTIFSFFGQFIHVLMGSGFQVLLPLSIALYFFYTEQRLSGAICLMWVGQNLINVSIYAGDSIVMQLPLLGGDSSTHDWHYLLTAMGILRYTPQVAATIYTAGIIVIALGIALAFYFAFTESPSRTSSGNYA
jgi:hypothetical protein